MAETWAPVVGYEQFYLVSTKGRVWRLARTIIRIHTRPYVQQPGEMALRVGNKLGHLCVTLYDANGVRHKHWVHRLVAEAHIPNPHRYPYVLHGLAGEAVNRVDNLRWGNQSMNEKDKLKHKIARQEMRT
jgi:hypothetical protein